MDLPKTYLEGFHYLNDVKKLQYNNLGKTGLKVSKIGFGGGCYGLQYGYVYYFNN